MYSFWEPVNEIKIEEKWTYDFPEEHGWYPTTKGQPFYFNGTNWAYNSYSRSSGIMGEIYHGPKINMKPPEEKIKIEINTKEIDYLLKQLEVVKKEVDNFIEKLEKNRNE